MHKGVLLRNTIFMAALLTFGVLATAAQAQAQARGLPDFTGLVEQASPAVVNITVTTFGNRGNSGGSNNDAPQQEEVPEIFRRFFDLPEGMPRNRPDRVGGGSGFIVESDGYIITNHHVIDGADQIIVRLSDRREFEAELIGSDEQSDIALLKIDSDDLPTLPLGDSDDLRVGEWVMAIGSPFALEQTVTQGIVSAKGRSNGQQQYVPFIQTDVAINRGNSGGPLLNLDGQVVGVNSWIFSNSGSYIGLSFSIPAEVASSTVRQLRETGRVSRGLLGVNIGPLNRELAEAFGLDRTAGALVSSVQPGSAADRAGIQEGDVILRLNEEPIEVWTDLPPLVGATPPGTEVELLINRNGEQQRVDATIASLEPGDLAAVDQETTEDVFTNILGIAVESISSELRQQLGDPEGGVIVSSVESDAAYRAGLRRGDVILRINNRPVEGLRDFEDIVEDLDMDKAVALLVQRDGINSFLAYRPEERG